MFKKVMKKKSKRPRRGFFKIGKVICKRFYINNQGQDLAWQGKNEKSRTRFRVAYFKAVF
jgi:hypothetical protein